ncbi:hypothetical protein K469DRAFT_585147, partial [Zopfia rhizophila CBS 207.26]
RRGFRKHYAHVREVVPKERILEFDLKDGTKPLCDFIGKDVAPFLASMKISGCRIPIRILWFLWRLSGCLGDG